MVDRHGLLVQRKDAWLATRRSGFDSPVVHSFTDRLDWKVAGYGWPGRTANAVSLRGMGVRIPCLPLYCPDGEEDDHASVLTRSPGFESWSGRRDGLIRGPGSEMDDHASVLTRCSGFESWPGHGSVLIDGFRGVTESHENVNLNAPGSTPGEGTLFVAPHECVGRTAVFEAARPGSIPGRGILFPTRPRSVTDSHTTLRRSRTRFNSWRGHPFLDAGARRPGDRLQPGSSGFDSHRRL